MNKFFYFTIALISLIALFYSDTFKTVAAGVAILIFGMIMLEEGFKTFTKGPLSKLIKKSTDKLYKSISLGFFTTSLLQSSSLISVITISFISAGFITLSSGIGIIFGANIGTTSTAWLVSLFGLKIKISLFAMPMLTVGVFMAMQNKASIKGVGNILAGLGFFFLGIYFMKEGFEVYKSSIDLASYAMEGVLGLFVYILIGIFITLILQSSSATLALILTALSTNQISFENSIALAIGANVGTTITALLGSISANIEGKRLAGAHLIFNVSTALIAVIFLYPLIASVNGISEWMNISPTNYTFKLSLFHSIFNIIGVLVMLPFIGKMVRFLVKTLKHKTRDTENPIYLNKSVLAHPQTAYQAILKETKHLFEGPVFEVLAHATNIHRKDIISENKFKEILKKTESSITIDVDSIYYKKIKHIYGEIIQFTTQVYSSFEVDAQLSRSITQMRLANRFLVDAVKTSKNLHKSISENMNSTNPEVKKSYDHLRKRLAKMLREVYIHHNDESDVKRLKRLEKVKKKALTHDFLLNGSLDNIIRQNLISPEMAATISNDYGMANTIIENIINVAEQLYVEDAVLNKHYKFKNLMEIKF